jgi:hypothetical protein
MIEFKAECGHTIRAKDEDAGGVVRCSYCGREATVPESNEDSLDFLFQDIGEVERPAGKPVKRRRSRTAKIFARRPSKEFDPFAVILRLCYAALLIIIVIVVGKTWLLPAFKKAETWWASTPVAKEPEPPKKRKLRGRGTEETAEVRATMAWVGMTKGLYVNSTPPGANIFIQKLEQEHTNSRDARSPRRVYRDPGLETCLGGRCDNLAPGDYLVEVAFRWNDVNLTGFPGYLDFRSQIERATDRQCEKLMREYFVPDGADAVFVDKTGERPYLVHQYRVQIWAGKLAAVRALFLPRITKATDPTAFSVEDLLKYLPTEKPYKLNRDHIEREFDYFTVPRFDREYVFDALSRVGVVPCKTEKKGTLLFKIDIQDLALDFSPQED